MAHPSSKHTDPPVLPDADDTALQEPFMASILSPLAHIRAIPGPRSSADLPSQALRRIKKRHSAGKSFPCKNTIRGVHIHTRQQSAKLLSCINYIDTIQPFFISPAAKIAYFFCFRAACLAWAAFADIMPASISLGTMIFAPKGLTTMPSAGQIFPLGSLRSIMAA